MEVADMSDTAQQKVGLEYAAGNPEVLMLKEAAARLITLIEETQQAHPSAAREAALAITHVQTASFFAVFAATAP